MTHPLRENLEVHTDAAGAWIRCSRCFHVLCPSLPDWRSACVRKLWSPTKAGPLMADLVGHYLLEQLSCPSCGVLFHTDFIEAEAGAEPQRKAERTGGAPQ